MDCTLSENVSKSIYLLIAKNRSVPPAIFTCHHCAEIWRKENLAGGYKILPLEADLQFVGELIDRLADIVKIHDSNDSAATGTLNKGEIKI